jgi:hypothetical protein
MNIKIHGRIVGEVRLKALENAIARIQKDGKNALSKEYVGVKNYAHFGDQRCDCQYGFGPSHGSIVFRIERATRVVRPKDDAILVLGDDEVYFLECARDFQELAEAYGEYKNLYDYLMAYSEANNTLVEINRLFNQFCPQTHS